MLNHHHYKIHYQMLLFQYLEEEYQMLLYIYLVTTVHRE